jgi:hypothetical protein
MAWKLKTIYRLPLFSLFPYFHSPETSAFSDTKIHYILFATYIPVNAIKMVRLVEKATHTTFLQDRPLFEVFLNILIKVQFKPQVMIIITL